MTINEKMCKKELVGMGSRFFTKIVIRIVLLVLFILPAILFGDEPYLEIKAKKGFPYFNQKGQLGIVYIKPEGILRNCQIQQNNFQELFFEDIYYKKNLFFPFVKKDKNNNIWVLWEERVPDRGDIYMARLINGKLTEIENISQGFEGFNFSPNMDFSLQNEIWLTWANYFSGKYKIVVKHLDTEQTWVVNSSSTSSALCPQILIDGNNRVWVFWIGQNNAQDEIFYSFFENGKWKKPLSLNNNSKVPHITPSVSLNAYGYPAITWSAYDGNDYEIYYSEWNGENWTPEEKVTENDGISDYSPSLALGFNKFPLIVWTRSFEGESEIYLKFKSFMGWSREINISQDEESSRFPVVVVEKDKIGILWESEENIKLVLYSTFLNLIQKTESNIKKILAFFSEELDCRKYIAFGNSITYGYLNRQPAPEKGYVPRLENLLDSNLEDSEVVNRGVPAEKTFEGLSRIDSVIQQDKALYILLMEGTNDIIHINISVETSKFNLEQMIKKCIQFKMFPFIATIIPRNDMFWYFKFYRDKIFKLNDYIRQLATDYSILLADQFEAFYEYPEEDGGWKSLLSDENHPNEKGYQLMAETWFNKIKITPFPPVNIKVKREKNEILFYSEIVNIITWEANPKISPETELVKYLIYRKTQEQPEDEFKLIAEVDASTFSYFDRDITSDIHYSYAIQAVSAEGIKGPISTSVNES